MALTKRSVQTLLDLVEIKLSCMQVFDREDAKELAVLENCRQELTAMVGRAKVNGTAAAIAGPGGAQQTSGAGSVI